MAKTSRGSSLHVNTNTPTNWTPPLQQAERGFAFSGVKGNSAPHFCTAHYRPSCIPCRMGSCSSGQPALPSLPLGLRTHQQSQVLSSPGGAVRAGMRALIQHSTTATSTSCCPTSAHVVPDGHGSHCCFIHSPVLPTESHCDTALRTPIATLSYHQFD